MKEEARRLNPFVYIPETDIRFYLLIVISIIMPSFWAVSDLGIVYSVIGETKIAFFQQLLGMFTAMFLLSFFIYWNYRLFPNKIIKKSKFKKFESRKFPEHYEYIEKLYEKHIPGAKQPELMYQAFDDSETAFTFGTKNHNHIGISGRIITKFRTDIKGFQTVILHELSHIANRDVEKTYLAASAWRILILTLLISIGIHILFQIGLAAITLLAGIIAGTDIDYLLSSIVPGPATVVYTVAYLYFLPFLITVYVLRNQIIRLREFYADARVLEWQKSPKELENTLGGISNKQLSRFEILTRFHPNIEERIQVLKNNLRLFTPSLWIAFSVGFLLGAILFYSLTLKQSMFSGSLGTGGWYDIGYQGFISIIFIMIAVAISSSFHKSILKNIFFDNKRYLSFALIMNAIIFSLVFSVGYITDALILTIIYTIGGVDGAMELLFEYVLLVIPKTMYFTIMLLYLLVFASMLIRRSYSKKEATKNFLLISGLFSLFNISYFHIVTSAFGNWHLFILLLLIFSAVAFIIIKIKDRRLSCPHCDNKISNLSGSELNCPNCKHNLYSWAVYSFS